MKVCFWRQRGPNQSPPPTWEDAPRPLADKCGAKLSAWSGRSPSRQYSALTRMSTPARLARVFCAPLHRQDTERGCSRRKRPAFRSDSASSRRRGLKKIIRAARARRESGQALSVRERLHLQSRASGLLPAGLETHHRLVGATTKIPLSHAPVLSARASCVTSIDADDRELLWLAEETNARPCRSTTRRVPRSPHGGRRWPRRAHLG